MPSNAKFMNQTRLNFLLILFSVVVSCIPWIPKPFFQYMHFQWPRRVLNCSSYLLDQNLGLTSPCIKKRQMRNPCGINEKMAIFNLVIKSPFLTNWCSCMGYIESYSNNLLHAFRVSDHLSQFFSIYLLFDSTSAIF